MTENNGTTTPAHESPTPAAPETPTARPETEEERDSREYLSLLDQLVKDFNPQAALDTLAEVASDARYAEDADRIEACRVWWGIWREARCIGVLGDSANE